MSGTANDLRRLLCGTVAIPAFMLAVGQGTNGRPGWNVFMLPPRMYGVTFKYER